MAAHRGARRFSIQSPKIKSDVSLLVGSHNNETYDVETENDKNIIHSKTTSNARLK